MRCGSQFKLRSTTTSTLLLCLVLHAFFFNSPTEAGTQLPVNSGEIQFLDSKISRDHSDPLLHWWVKPGPMDAGDLETLFEPGGLNPDTLLQKGWAVVQVPGAVENAPNVRSEDQSFVYLKAFNFTEAPKRDLLLSLGQISDKDRTFLNGNLIGETGDWDSSMAQAYDKPRFYHVPKEMIRTNAYNLVLIEVQRYFSDASGILQGSVYLGPVDSVLRRHFLMESAQIWVVPCYFIISCAFFFMYWQRSRQVDYGVFGLFTLLLCVYVSLRSPLRYLFEFDFIFWKRVEYLICFSTGSLLFWFFELFWCRNLRGIPAWHRRIGTVCHWSTVVVLITVLLTGNPRSWFWTFNHIVIFLWGIYAILAFRLLVSRMRMKDMDAIWMAIGLACFLIAVLVDVLKVKDVHSAPVMVIGYGCFALIASIALVLANRFIRVYREVEYLNSNLEHEVREQTLELRQAVVAAQAADEIKSQFLANVSHELRTPMNGIVGMRHLLAQTDLSPQQKEYLSTLSISTHALRELIDEMLDFASLEKKGQRQSHENFEPLALFEQVVQSLETPSRNRGNTVRLSVDKNVPPKVHGDSKRIAQVIHHLLRNAVKFTHRGMIEIKFQLIDATQARQEGVQAKGIYYGRCEVIDTGIGIPKEMLETVFQPFTQVDSSLTRNYGGLGVGLAICKRLIQHMDGVISVESNEGKGSRFWFVLPLHAARESKVAMTHSDTKKIHNQTPVHLPEPSGRLLMVEDNEVNVRYLKLIMEKAGYNVITASNGKDAMTILEQQSVDLVLMDLQMPVMDGYEATRAIREQEKQNPEIKSLPIFAVTAHGGIDDRRRAMDAGMNAYFVKPIDPDELKKAIKSFIQQPIDS